VEGHLRASGIAIAIAIASFISASSAFAAPACGPLNLITSVDIITVSGGRPGIGAKIMDKPVTLLVDTGGASSMISRSVVRELSLPVSQAQMEVVNVAGQRSHEQVRLPSITLGTLRQEGAYFMIDPADVPKEERSFDGVIAPDFLSRVDADFDFAAKKLNLVSPNHCEGKVVYWSAPASAPALAVVPFRMDRSGHISLPVRLDGQRVNAILDTGAYNTALNLDIARRTFSVDTNGPDVQKMGQVEGGYKADIFRKQFKTLSIEGVAINSPVIDLLPDLMSPPGGTPRPTGSIIRDSDNNLPGIILGMNVLSKLHVYIAYKEAKLYLSANGPDAPAP
jgi:predicted aspartyl protease